jgi:ubiquinone biosynthesis protein Coq4
MCEFSSYSSSITSLNASNVPPPPAAAFICLLRTEITTMENTPSTIYSVIARRSIREAVAWKIVEAMKPLYFFLRKNKKAWTITVDDLRTMENGTLGKDLFLFLQRNNLQLIPKAEFHDVYHVLFDLTTNIRDEACVQFIPLGNGRRSLPYVSSTLIAAVFYPEYWDDFFRAYMKGRRARTFHTWNFEQMLHMKTTDIRKMIFD